MLEQENTFIVKERMFNDYQLGQLQEIKSTVDCECPNQVSTIVNSLASFEIYSQKCINKNDQDEKLHTLIYEKTSQARTIMEEALKAICIYENINI